MNALTSRAWGLALTLGLVMPAAAIERDIRFENPRFQVGFLAQQMDYDESDAAEIENDFFGIQLIVTERLSQAWDGVFTLNYLNGADGDYEGTAARDLLFPEVGEKIKTDTDDEMAQVEMNLGYWFNDTLRGFIGLGYRYWTNDINGDISLERETDYFYMPMGFNVVGYFNSSTYWRLTGQFNLLLAGSAEMQSDNPAEYSPFEQATTSAPFDDQADIDIDGGYGWQISADLRHELKRGNMHIGVSPYIKYWDMDETDTDQVFIARDVNNEPIYGRYMQNESDTTSIGAFFYLAF